MRDRQISTQRCGWGWINRRMKGSVDKGGEGCVYKWMHKARRRKMEKNRKSPMDQ